MDKLAASLPSKSVPGLLAGSWRKVLLVNALLLATACSDGYPGGEARVLSSSEMNVDQLVTAMNVLGEKPHLPSRWRYALEPGCVLEVRKRRSGMSRQTIAVSLYEADVSMKQGIADQAFDIQLEPAEKSLTVTVPVLKGGKWADAVHMRSLLIHLQRSCDTTVSP
ncbi:MAG: hypothetical protein Q8O29_02705 [Polaromonas sp.]|uniref:hypothetical protein n=1 Tax=Polaromonas sp. TaxID=1869339 RepID=UPI0027370D69|nr:hypothetical protein [Polaromonas sp.]MDP2817185.1 hypothetical protein [Polaromonas sp.]